MPTLFIKIGLFLSSYAPLAVVFLFLFAKEDQAAIGWTIAGIGLAGVVLLRVFLSAAAKMEPTEITVASVERRDTEALSYVASYVIPFVAVPGSDIYQALALTVFFIVLAVIYINSNLIYINPTLTLLGFHLYEVTDPEGNSFSLIAKQPVRRGAHVRAVIIGDEIAIASRPK